MVSYALPLVVRPVQRDHQPVDPKLPDVDARLGEPVDVVRDAIGVGVGADHDLEAGNEFRQRGDWTADEHGGPQVQEPDGTVHEPDAEGDEAAGDADRSAEETGGESASGESALEDVRDGGHGWGSAAPIEGGVQPLGHPVKAWHDTMTYVQPGQPGYVADPHEWFVDGETAERAEFRPAHGG